MLGGSVNHNDVTNGLTRAGTFDIYSPINNDKEVKVKTLLTG